MSVSVTIPDDLAARLRDEAAKRETTPDALVAELIAERIPARGRRLSFAGIGASTSGRSAVDVEDWLLEEFRR